MNSIEINYSKMPDEWLLRNLLSLIHRDGGRYTAANGIVRSCEEAEFLLMDYFKTRDSSSRKRKQVW